MYDIFAQAISYLGAQSLTGLLALFWFTVIFEVPRYTIAFVSAALYRLRLLFVKRRRLRRDRHKMTVIVAGYNEQDNIRKCVLSLREQSRPPDEIIVVSDGSTDRMPAVLRDLLREGLIDRAHCTELRAGKSGAMNLADRWAGGDIIVNVDCDCSYDRHALRNILARFDDPRVGAVSGNILVRNPRAGIVATYQAIEYLISISLGKQAADLIDQVVCVSGAFGAFRRTALDSVNGVDVGGGEDLDLSLRLRKAGWRVCFEDDAICYTDVPVTLEGLTAQRFRWERDAIRIRYRKHLDMLNPFSKNFRLSELIHEIDFIIFQILGAAVLPFYVIWLVLTYGALGPVFFLAAQIGLLGIDIVMFLLAALATPRANALPLLIYVPGYSLFNGVHMRFVRLFAYVQEWIFNASADDNYVPGKVRVLRKW